MLSGDSLAFSRSSVLAIVLALVAWGPPALRADDWPRWRGPNNDGISTETGWTAKWPDGGPRQAWKANVGKGFSSVSVADGRLFTMGNQGGQDIVWCLDAATGKELWSHKYPCPEGDYPGPRMTPTVDGDSVYTLSRDGHLFALGAKDGKVLWQKHVGKDFGAKSSNPGWGLACSPLVLGDRLLLDLGKAIALDKKTGGLVWSSGGELAAYSSPTLTRVGGRTFMNCFTPHGLVLVDVANGKELARARWETSYDVNAASPIESGGRVFVSSGYGKGCGLFEVKGGALELVYESKKMRNHCNSCVLLGGDLYGLDGQMGGRGALACLDFATGEMKWQEKGFAPGGIIVADGKILAMCDKGELVVAEASPEKYTELARAKVLEGQCWTSPVLANGRIYCRSNDKGVLVCLDVGGK